jgi:hypothetical protein
MKPARRRRIGLVLGLIAGVSTVGWLDTAGNAELHAPGPMNASHDGIACEGCHEPAPGTLRQQLQAKVRAAFAGADDVDLGHRPVTAARCRRCHQRPDDRHPVGRFLEPRFAEVRERLRPDDCTTCHAEHRGARVTAGATFCQHCHADLALEHDPLDVPHRQLAAFGQWQSCLGCHDYHGNHGVTPPRSLAQAIAVEQIEQYFEGGASPYPPPIRHAKEVSP